MNEKWVELRYATVQKRGKVSSVLQVSMETSFHRDPIIAPVLVSNNNWREENGRIHVKKDILESLENETAGRHPHWGCVGIRYFEPDEDEDEEDVIMYV